MSRRYLLTHLAPAQLAGRQRGPTQESEIARREHAETTLPSLLSDPAPFVVHLFLAGFSQSDVIVVASSMFRSGGRIFTT
jgi:hypothetical protein